MPQKLRRTLGERQTLRARFEFRMPYPKYTNMPITNQMRSRSQVTGGNDFIRYAADKGPAGATNQTQGVLNTRGRLGSRTRKTRIPTDTITNASSVPIDTRLAASRIGKIAAKNATTTPVTIDVMYGVWNLGWTLFMNGGSRPSRDIE